MRDPNRLYYFYDELRNIHMQYFPDWRFGQLISNFLEWLCVVKKIDFFFPEEEKTIELFKEYTERKSKNVL